MAGVIIVILGTVLFLCIGGVGALIYSFFNRSSNELSMQNKTKAVDIFVYVGILITLIVSVTNILQILFAAIDRKFVDVLDTVTSADITNDSVRFAIASLIVVFPVYLGLSWFASRDIAKFLYKRDLLVRKVMIYVTLFATVCTLIGTLVSVIYSYLGGELSLRGFYKALSIFVVSLFVFGYYSHSLKREYKVGERLPLILGAVAALFVVASIVWSIGVIGTPAQMRLKKIDSARLTDISRIQQEVFNHFQNTEKLPLSLSELDDAFQGYAVPTDPVTKESYGYTVIQQPVVKMNYQLNKKELSIPAIFEICADFATERAIDARGTDISSDKYFSASNYYYEYDGSPFWNHKATSTCFKRIITKDMYYGGK